MTGPSFRVQAVAAATQALADDAVAKLKAVGFDAIVVPDKGLFKVQAGPFPSRAAATAALRRIRDALGDGPFVVQNP